MRKSLPTVGPSQNKMLMSGMNLVNPVMTDAEREGVEKVGSAAKGTEVDEENVVGAQKEEQKEDTNSDLERAKVTHAASRAKRAEVETTGKNARVESRDKSIMEIETGERVVMVAKDEGERTTAHENGIEETIDRLGISEAKNDSARPMTTTACILGKALLTA